MRKRVKGTKLSRKKDARMGLAKSLVRALILTGSIKTTKARAKFAQRYIEKLINLAKKNSLALRRRIFAELGDKTVSKKLISEVIPKFANINSGFTRVVNSGNRLGDAAPMALLEFVFPEQIKTTNEIEEDKVKRKPR